MKVRDDEGVAIRIGPEPCIVVRKSDARRFWIAVCDRLEEFSLSHTYRPQALQRAGELVRRAIGLSS